MEEIHTHSAPEAIGPYSQAIRSGNLVFTSGQIPISPATGELAGDDILSQAEQVMKNIQAVLSAAGSGLERAVKPPVFWLICRTLLSSIKYTPNISLKSPLAPVWRSRSCPNGYSARWK